MTASPEAGDAQIANACAALGTTAIARDETQLATQLVIILANLIS